MQAELRAASVQLLRDFAAYADLKLAIYAGRPRQVAPPHAFVDRITETLDYLGPKQVQRHPRAEIVVIHGLFDSGDAVAQKDQFVDGFVDWVRDNRAAAGTNTTVGVLAVEDEPVYRPDWQPEEQQRDYYATRITLEGLALD